MTDSRSLYTLAYLLRTIPGVEAAYVFRDPCGPRVCARLRCLDIAAIDVLAYCGMAANTQVTVSEIDSRLCCESNSPRGLPCDIHFSDDCEELPTESQRFGFFVAKTLYSRGVIDDALLDSLEHRWQVNFSRPKQ